MGFEPTTRATQRRASPTEVLPEPRFILGSPAPRPTAEESRVAGDGHHPAHPGRWGTQAVAAESGNPYRAGPQGAGCALDPYQ